MTDNEIIKALECCGNQMYSCTDKDCKAKTLGNALDLINRQKAEIERLQEEWLQINKTFMGFVNKREYEAINRFVERLKEKSQVSIYCDRRLKKCLEIYRITDDELDNLVNEEMKERL